jgi:hypothetical protein
MKTETYVEMEGSCQLDIKEGLGIQTESVSLKTVQWQDLVYMALNFSSFIKGQEYFDYLSDN